MEDVDRTLSPTTEIMYGGTVIASLGAGQIATLACSRKMMKADVIVLAGSGGSGSGNTSVITDGSVLFVKTAAVAREDDSTLMIT